MVLKTAEALQISNSNSQFTNNLYNILAGTSPGNIVFSPVSLHAVLSMVYQGAQGTTAEKFASSLKVPDAKVASDGYSVIMKRLTSIPNVTLLMAIKIYLMEGHPLLPDFSEAVTNNFLCDVQLLNFCDQAAAAATINTWVEEKTQEKTMNLVNKEDFDESTQLVLVNAIYFKSRWRHAFDKGATKTEPFYLNDTDSVPVQMMYMKRRCYHNSIMELEAQMLELLYANGNLSMVIILPFERNGIAELEKKLTTVNLAKITNEVYNPPITVALPKFKIEQTIDLKDSLTKLGLGEIFDRSAANFSGMVTSKEPLHVSKVIQRAFIEVSEEGSDPPPVPAAAAGRRRRGRLCHVEGPDMFFTADHPFIFMLLEKSTGTHILFTGKIMNPQF
ncbi:serine protease inhibitor 42Dd-like [Zophobas morio]|uniref:serine protease inhibitor 42Dd-like n=1 Tax=Zophobas morio TaxID=2755281 RepID=UPI003083E2ED